MRSRKPIIVSIILAILAAVMLFAVSCGDDDKAQTYTMTFVTDGGTEIEPIKSVGGSMIFVPDDPQKTGSTFAGWYDNPDYSGDAVEIPNVMPHKNVTYYAKFDSPKTEYTLIYDYNLGKAPHAADIANVTVEAGSTVTVADGNDYGAVGYMFMGWSIAPNGIVADVKQEGQYDAGDKITLTDKNVKLYAQWATEYTDSRGENADSIYVYEPLIGKGKGAAMLIRADKEKTDLDGFVRSADETASGYNEFTFYAEEFVGGEFMGRLYANRTYATSDGKQGQYVQYDCVFGDIWQDYVLALDGFGYAIITTTAGNQLKVFASGDYEYDPEQGVYEFKYNTDKDDEGAKQQTTYFILDTKPVEFPIEGSEEKRTFDGLFATIGGESGTYAHLYINNNAYDVDYYIELDGFGGATFIDVTGEEDVEIYGGYYGTDNYTSVVGEWEFEPDNQKDAGYRCKFTLNVVQIPNGTGVSYIPVFYICDEEIVGVYTTEDENDKSTLYLDGYGMAEYIANGVLYVGTVVVNDNVVEFTEWVEDATTGQLEETDNVMTFIITLAGKKFALSPSGLIIENGVVTGYNGNSKIVEIPATFNDVPVTEIAAGALNYNNTSKNISLVSITVPASVTTIGDRAFQNNHTLRRIVFLSTTPVTLDFSDANDPFRWGAGDFIIVVPQDDDVIAAYKEAWPKYADKIKGRDDAARLPEFEVNDNGVLIRYNKPEGLEEGTLLDIIIPDTVNGVPVTEIADYVFRGVTGIRSVDLNNVTKVGDSAFYACADLETVKMPNVEELGEMAFAACYLLNNSDADVENVLELPAIKTIGESAFSACESLRLVQLGESIEEIGDFAFYECNVYEDDPPLFVELLGTTAPEMGEKVTLGNIAFRFKVQNVDVALNCYNESTWSSYCRHLYVESGDEKGTYISGEDTLVLDGRAVYQSSYVWMYAIDGEKITFYEYDPYSESSVKYATIEGTYKDETIRIVIGSNVRNFKRLQKKMTYTTKDGKYTLECDPMDLQPESYENNKGVATVKFNDVEVELYVNGYSTKTIYEFEEDGKKYDISITFNGEVMEVSKKLSDVRYKDIKAPDDSEITILFRNGNVYIEKAEFDIVVDESTGRKLYWTEASGMGVIAQQNGNVFTFSFTYRSTKYNITVTVSDAHDSFTYEHTTA